MFTTTLVRQLFGTKYRTNRRVTPRSCNLAFQPLEARSLMAASLTASLNVAEGILRVEGTYGNDKIHIRQSGGDVRIDGINITVTDGATTTTAPFVSQSEVTRIDVAALDGEDVVQIHDTLRFWDQPIPARIHGGAGNDTLIGGKGGDYIFGEGGVDSIQGGSGNDSLYGDANPYAAQLVRQYSLKIDTHGMDLGKNEKWLLPKIGFVGDYNYDVFYILPNGELHRYANETREKETIDDVVVATLDPANYQDIRTLETTRGLYDYNFYYGGGNRDEKWFLGFGDPLNNGWFFITPTGELYRWDGLNWGTDIPANGSYIDLLDFSYHADPREFVAAGVDGNEKDVINGQAGDDVIYGGGGSDFLQGAEGNDSIYGGDGADTLLGGIGDDQLAGENDNDWLSGDQGADTLIGCFYGWHGETGNANDTIYGGAGNDSMYGGDGNDVMTDEAGNNYFLSEDGNDTLVGSDGNDTMVAGTGNDWLQGQGGNDLMYGEGGDDVLMGGFGANTLVGGDGSDYLEGGANNDQLFGAQINSPIEVGNNQDSLYGMGGNDILWGGDGDDLLVGGGNQDTLRGEGGQDLLYGGNWSTSYETGSNLNDDLDGGTGNDTLYGGYGNDLLAGGDGNDELHGDAGNDVLNGAQWGHPDEAGAANDTLFGSTGNDTLYGGVGSDWLWGEDGNDLIYAEAGDDAIDGGKGNDALYGGDNNDNIVGGEGADVLHGDSGNDTLWGASYQNNYAYQDKGNVIDGEAGNDNLYGGNAGDYMDGGAGNDGLFGGLGYNTLIGNDGADRFLVRTGLRDNIVDQEVIDARVIFTNGDATWTDAEIAQNDVGLAFLHALTNNTSLLKLIPSDGSGELQIQRVKSLGLTTLGDNDSTGRIRITDYAFAGVFDVAENIIHEIGHDWDTERGTDLTNQWLALSGWQAHDPKNGSTPAPGNLMSGDGNWEYQATALKGFWRNYGKTNPNEDWSTMWEAYYRYKSGTLAASDAARLQSKLDFIDKFMTSQSS